MNFWNNGPRLYILVLWLLSKQQGVEAPPTWIDDEGESDNDGENKQNLNDVHHKRLGELSDDVPTNRRITECYVAKESHQ